jgi:antitoxin ParD1/3/4
MTRSHWTIANFSAKSYMAPMAQMNVSLPEGLKAWAESRVAEGRYSSTSDYVRDLMRRDQEDAERIRFLQRKIDEGRASGVSEKSVEEIFADLYAKLGA